MELVLANNMVKELGKLAEITGTKANSQYGIRELDSGYLLLQVNTKECSLQLTTSINSSNGIQGKLILPLKRTPEIRENFACFVECTKFIQFVGQGQQLAGPNEERSGHTVTTLNFNSTQKRLTITTEKVELIASDKEELQEDWLANNEPKVKKVSTPAHSMNYIPAQACYLPLYDFPPVNAVNLAEDIAEDMAEEVEAKEFHRALSNTLITAKFGYQGQVQNTENNEVYWQQTPKGNLVFYGLSRVGKSIEVLPYSTKLTAREHFIALSIKTAATLVKISNDASNIQLKFTGKKIELVIDNICLLVNTVTQKTSKEDLSPSKESMHQPSCDVDTLHAMLSQVLTDDKQHSAIIFKAKDSQTKELLVTTKYQGLTGNNVAPETALNVVCESPFSAQETYGYNLAIFDHAVSALISLCELKPSYQWQTDAQGHLQFFVPGKQYYQLTAIRKS